MRTITIERVYLNLGSGEQYWAGFFHGEGAAILASFLKQNPSWSGRIEIETTEIEA